MAISIFCPDCNRKYMVTEKHIGKKVVCADSSCGRTFIAAVDEPSDSELDFSYDQSDVEVIKKERPTPPPISPPVEQEEEYPFPTNVRRRMDENEGHAKPAPCRFVSIGRAMVYCGLLILLAGAICPSTVRNEHVDTGRFALPGEVFNLSMACAKLTIVIMGMSVMISGAAIWSGSQSGPSKWDVLALRILMLLVVFFVLSFVALMVAARVQ